MAHVLFTPAPTVLPQPTPPSDYQRIETSPAMFGALPAQATERAGAQIGQAGDQLFHAELQRQDRFNQVAADDAFNKLQSGYFKLTYGDPSDPNSKGIYGMRGADALRAKQPTFKAMDDLRQQIRGGLNLPQQIQFDQASRRLQMFTADAIGRHLDQQANSYADAVNVATERNQMQAIGASYNDDTAFNNSLAEARRAAVQRVQTLYGNNPAPELVQSEINRVTSAAIVTRAQAWGASDPAAALAWLKPREAYVDAAEYTRLTRSLESAHNGAAVAAGAQEVLGGGGAQGVLPSSDIYGAIHGQEGTPAGVTSSAGARSSWQIEPATFAQYAKPGEVLSSERDANAVAHRIIDDYRKRFNDDPQRVAVAYFSGPDNVAPVGSPTPWKVDKRDTNGTSTSQYVRGVMARIGSGAAQKPFVVGDSIAAGIQSAGSYQGSAKVGAAPPAVLQTIQALPSDQVRGQSVVLSSGVSNDPSQIDVVGQQIAALKAKGAASVTLVGVGTRQDFSGLNDKLQQIAQQSGAHFVPIDPSSLSADQVHPASYQGLASVVGGSQQRAPQYVVGSPDGLVKPGNLDLNARPVVHNPDGTISTVRSITIGGEDGEPAILLPTVIGNKVVSNEEAIRHFRQTGENLGTFDTEAHADAYAESLHEAQAKEYAPGAGVGTPSPRHQPTAYTTEAEIVNRAWATAEQKFPDRPDLQRQMVDVVWQRIQENNALQAKFEAEQAKAQRDAQEAAGQRVMRTLMTPGAQLDPATIRDDPSLSYEQKDHLWNIVQAHSQQSAANRDIKTYGAGFWGLYQDIHAQPGDPHRITDPSELWVHGGPNGDLTLAGIEKLTAEIQGRRTPEGEAESKMKAGALAYAKHQLSFERDLGVVKIRDPKGEDVFNVGFLPAFYKAYDAGIAGGKTPYQLLSKDSPDFIMDKLIAPYKRSSAQIAADMLAENQDVGGGGAAPTLPPAKQLEEPAPDLTTQAGIIAAFNQGKIDRAKASQMLIERGFARPVQGPAAAPKVPTDE